MGRPKKQNRFVKCSIYLDPDIKEKLEEMASSDDRSLSYMVNKAAEAYVLGEGGHIKEIVKPKEKSSSFDLSSRELPKF